MGIISEAHSESKLKQAGTTMTFQSMESFYQNLKNNASLIQKMSFSSLQSKNKLAKNRGKV